MLLRVDGPRKWETGRMDLSTFLYDTILMLGHSAQRLWYRSILNVPSRCCLRIELALLAG